MGSCLSADRKQRDNKTSLQGIPQLNNKEKQYLSLIYWDLANRNKSKMLDQHHFSLFFQLTGLWGDKLFKYFVAGGEHEISLTSFISTMNKIVRAPFQEKTLILFNFIKNPQDDGIRYKQFLKMLYHYSKPELKQIMTNDGVFVHESIIPSSKQLQKQKKDGIVHLKHEPSLLNIEDNKGKSQFERAYQKISKDYQDPGTLIQFQTQKVTYQVSYCNMGSLTKEYASHIFYKYNINQEHGSMNLSQFRSYVEGNMKLFNTYFAVFHQNLWGFEKNAPLFLKHVEKQSSIRFGQEGKKEPGYLMLAFDALIISSEKNKPEEVLRIINLVGLQVQEQNQQVMVIKDESSEIVNIQIEFASSGETKSWLEELKSYSNNYFKNKYDILEQIGTGRYSVVYKCRERMTKKEYALKVLQLGKLEQKQIAAIENESEIMKILKSNQFIKQYETIATRTTIYIVSQYIFGEDLYEYVRKKKKLPEAEAAFLLGMIIQAVIHLHNIDIIHRDLKPENIMVSYKKQQRDTSNLSCSSPHKMLQPRPETIKLIDFGFANYCSVLQESEHQDVPVGTLGYMAPEILLGQKPSFQNDTFSIGCIMYFLLRGKYPFSSTNPEGTAILTVKGEYSLYDSVWSEVSSAAKELIEMLLKTDPIQRISLKEALNHTWFSQVHNYHS